MLDQQQINLLDEYTQGTWEYDYDYGHVNINGDFVVPFQGVTHFESIRFGYVRGDFNIANNRIAKLYGMPIHVEGSFICTNNRLESLQGIPPIINGDLHIGKNPIKGFEGVGKVSGSIFAKGCLIMSLEGLPLGLPGDYRKGAKVISDYFSFDRDDILSAIAAQDNDSIKSEMLRWITPWKINEEISNDPGLAMTALKTIWRHEGLKGLKDELDILPGQLEAIEVHSDLGEIGY